MATLGTTDDPTTSRQSRAEPMGPDTTKLTLARSFVERMKEVTRRRNLWKREDRVWTETAREILEHGLNRLEYDH